MAAEDSRPTYAQLRAATSEARGIAFREVAAKTGEGPLADILRRSGRLDGMDPRRSGEPVPDSDADHRFRRLLRPAAARLVNRAYRFG